MTPLPQPAASFITTRDRDASDTIRGYVYQVDLTIKRWLDLRPEQTLELERGEDIDLAALLADPAEQQRLLEQVKCYQNNLTLRSPEALESLASFREHRASNPALSLLFRYTTTAGIGRERNSPLPNGLAGITAWEMVRGGCAEPLQQNLLAGLRSLLQNVRCPPDLNETTWTAFTSFVRNASAEEFLAFVQAVEWSTGAPSSPSLSVQIQVELVTRGHAPNLQQARAQYHHLFFYVFKILSQPGLKRLTNEDLTAQLAIPTLEEADQTLREGLTARLDELDSRMAAIEMASGRHDAALQELTIQVRQAQGLVATLTPVAPPDLDIPPIAPTASRRSVSVTNLATMIDRYTWTAIYGGAGVGRTQLMALLAQARPHRCAWVRLYGLSSPEACRAIDAACSAITGQQPLPHRQPWYNRSCQVLGRDALVVLDDLPRLDGGDELTARLIVLARAAAANGVHLATLGAHPLPAGVIGQLGHKKLHEIPAPLFSDDEAADILRAAGAPAAALSPQTVGFINALAGQHPMVLAAIARELQRRHWRFTENDVAALLQRGTTTRLADAILPRLVTTVEDEGSRELLARLCLIGRAFSDDDARAVAAVAPAIAHPTERLAQLLGLWLVRDTTDHLTISPLIRTLSDDLSPDTRRACHHVLGQRVIRGRSLDQMDALAAIAHFMQADEPDRAAMLLASVVVEFLRSDLSLPDFGLLTLWVESLPAGLSPDVALYLRAVQIAARVHRGLPTTSLVTDLDARVAAAGENASWGVIMAAMYAPMPANPYLTAALRRASDIHLPDGSRFAIPNEAPLEYLLWMHVDAIKTQADLRGWLDVVTELTPEQRTRAFQGPLAEGGCLHVSEALRQQELKRAPREQRWHAVLAALDDLASRAEDLGLDLLWACATRVQIEIHAEHLDDLDLARNQTDKALAHRALDPRVQFLLAECLGQAYLSSRRSVEALHWLDHAIAQDTPAYPYRRLRALISASKASAGDLTRAVGYAEEAVHIARANDEIPESEMVRALGELAIACWKAEGVAAAFMPWAEAGDRLLACKAETDQWKDLFVTYGHASGYLTALATGTSLTQTIDGDDYTPPWPGMFVGPLIPGRAARYDETRDCFILTQLATYAQAVGDDTRAAIWMGQGLDLARGANQKLALLELGMDLIPQLVVDDRFGAAIDAAREIAPLGIALWSQRAEREGLWKEVDVTAVLGPPSSEAWRDAEYLAAKVSLIPIAFRLATVIQRDPAHGRRMAQEVADLCRSVANEAADADLWIAASDIFAHIYALEQRHDACIARTPTHQPVLHVLGYLGATLQRDTIPEWALRAQLIVLPSVAETTQLSTAYRRLVLPFLSLYWTAMLDATPFRFIALRSAHDDLSRAQAESPERQGQAILRAIADHLPVRLPPDETSWLRATGHQTSAAERAHK